MEQTLSREEKLKILKALEEDREFRYAVAGLIGVSDILERLDRIEENIEKLWIEVKSLRENQEKLWIEVKSLRENQEKLWIEVKSLRENQEKLWIEVRDLREVQVSMLETQRTMLSTLNRLSATVDRLTLSVEEEARDVVRHRLKEELGVVVAVDRLFIDDKEIDLYGVGDDLVLVGEATVRLGVRLLDELEDKINYLRLNRPELLRPRLIKAVYTDYAPPAALESARERGIWVLKWSGDLTPKKIHRIKVSR
ncbi:MAG: hypothetical protein QXV77_06665 [Candidatus Bathyarchaeia archaeon]